MLNKQFAVNRMDEPSHLNEDMNPVTFERGERCQILKWRV